MTLKVSQLKKKCVSDLVDRNHRHFKEISSLADTLIANEVATERLCELNPRMAETYRKALEKATADIQKMLDKLHV